MPCRDGVRRVFADQADIASTKREAAWGVRQFAQRVSCILLRTACEADFLAHGWQRRMKHFLGGGGRHSRNHEIPGQAPAGQLYTSSSPLCSRVLPVCQLSSMLCLLGIPTHTISLNSATMPPSKSTRRPKTMNETPNSLYNNKTTDYCETISVFDRRAY